ncbi:lipoate-protein ligase A [Lentibacillus persicus]|uniref:lipoate--protein ligase n=1 Tax=Lentibacillus persicus TaxID=640948 RepID=A0A1I1SE01_9BACI|nr:lipoate--protein ligase [Lentibacillus persicus]SFD41220.1 lipoate-protein ligase A [Lentibacillus persicus]
MYLIESKRNGEWIYDPGMIMALQEYVKDNIFLDEAILFPYMMDPVVQIGKFQNAFEEINQPYMDDHDIKMIRRESGGGAIYLDDRNMSFCFLVDGAEDIYGNYARLYEPAIKALEKLGVTHVEHKGRNDLVLNDKKISGAAMTVKNDRVYAGYSLLLDPDYEAMVNALNPNQKKIASHGIQSVRSRVGAIRDHLAPDYQDMTVWEFADFMMCELLGVNDINEAKRYDLTPEDWAGVEKIAAEKYHNWDWNYGRFNQFEYHLTERFPIGTISIGLGVERGKIGAIEISGDFFGTSDLNAVEEALIGVRLRRDAILNALEPLDLMHYFGDITKEEFTRFILSENR